MSVSQHTLKAIAAIALRYWALRDAGNMSEERTVAHNDLLDALEAAGIPYQDREDAAQIGLNLIAQERSPDVAPAIKESIVISTERGLKEQFKRYAARYGGMTAVLLRYINEFVDTEVQKRK